MTTCEEVKFQSDNLLSDIASQRQTPIIVRSAVSQWPAVKASLASDEKIQDYLLSFANTHPVLVYETKADAHGRIFYNDALDGMNFTREMRSVTDVFDRINSTNITSSGEGVYMGSTNIDQHFPGFREKNLLNFDVPASESLANLWLGNQTQVAAHYDYPNNFACCVAGSRTFRLFPPNQLSNLYVGPLAPTPGGPAISLVDGQRPDYQRYPKYKEALASSISAELHPGDVLFIPSMWWHEVLATDAFNVLVNYWWKPTPAYIPSPQVALDAALLTIKSLPKEQKDAWKTLFDFYIFGEESLDHIPDSVKGVLGTLDKKHAMQLRAKLLNALNR